MSISPPPLKRHKISPTPTPTPPYSPEKTLKPSVVFSHTSPEKAKTQGNARPKAGLKIVAWNVNGITPLLPSSAAAGQRSITSFFEKKRKRTRRAGSTPPKEDVGAGETTSLRAVLERNGWPDLLLLQEVKIGREDEGVMVGVRRAINHHHHHQDEDGEGGDGDDQEGSWDGGPRYNVHFNRPRDTYNARGLGGKGRVYGVATILREDLASTNRSGGGPKCKGVEVRDVDWDQEGRIQVIEIIGVPLSLPSVDDENNNNDSSQEAQQKKNTDTDIAVINIYAVNGTNAPYRSPLTGQVVGTRHDRKVAVHAHLMRESLALQRRGFSVVIAGDLNVAPGPLDGYPKLRTFPEQHCLNRADFNEKFLSLAPKTDDGKEGFGGIDTFRHVHGQERRYSYYPRDREWGSSCDRVDLCIVSRGLKRNVVGAGILDNQRDRGVSDHCPIWVELG